MSVQYGAIGWNRQKKVYDLTLLSLLALYLGIFVGVGAWRNPSVTAETLLIRAFGTAAFLLLNVVLCIGPLSRLDRRFLPLLYNRRHLGVVTFLLGLAHGGFGLIQFHALGNVNPLVSLFISNPRYGSVADFPFQALGFFALIILFLMAATSHDFWLRNLSAPMWKRLHMLVYLAYALLVAHVTLGALQSETSPVLAAALIVGVATVLSLHLAAAFREKRVDRARHHAVRRRFRRGLQSGSYRREMRDHRISLRRARRGLPLRRQGLCDVECLPTSEWTARRRAHYRWLRHLPVAWLPVSARVWGGPAAVQGKGPHLPGQGCGRICLCASAS